MEEPQQDFFDPLNQNSQEPLVRHHEQYGAVKDTGKDRNFSSLLTRLVTAACVKRTRISTQIATERATTYQLNNSGEWFRNAPREASTRQWTEQAIEQGDDVYLIVGYHTLRNARITALEQDVSECLAELNLPITTAALAFTGVGVGGLALTSLGEIADPAISGSLGSGESSQKQFIATEEQVIAIQYRRLRFRWYSSRNIDRATLMENNRWQMCWDMRGQEDEQTDDVVEVDLVEELELEQGQGEESTYNENVSGMETFLY